MWLMIAENHLNQGPWLANFFFFVTTLVVIFDAKIYPEAFRILGFVPLLMYEFVLVKLIVEVTESLIWGSIVHFSFDVLPDLLDMIPLADEICISQVLYGGRCVRRIYDVLGGSTLSDTIVYLMVLLYFLLGLVLRAYASGILNKARVAVWPIIRAANKIILAPINWISDVWASRR
ncbi:uncharacterized protein LOC113380736 [Ctenocephalides felis]|uniref:uncharacterized protein LOC113378506 n=1 Tax=Ctenocephalides felis TaxID=7515 RepID=UPI000E6E4991|nr:uncharacterized protein LOC113378506 [Ctenocephalides felis]XP_026475653.1 uncharacterized protein LOC113380736 [Ctenocephalides felis]